MKRFSLFLTLLMMAALSLTFTSCEDDWYDDRPWYDRYDDVDDAEDLAEMLNGTWSGTIINEYTNDQGVRQQTQCSANFTFVQYNSDAISGRGYETDYDGSGNSQTLEFKWSVDERTGDIYVEYSSGYRFILDASSNSKYSGFSLDNSRFNGVMEGTNNDEYIFFDLYRVRGNNAPHKLNKSADSTSTVRFGKGEGKQFEASDVPVMLRKR